MFEEIFVAVKFMLKHTYGALEVIPCDGGLARTRLNSER